MEKAGGQALSAESQDTLFARATEGEVDTVAALLRQGGSAASREAARVAGPSAAGAGESTP